jgi:hypothetical protein
MPRSRKICFFIAPHGKPAKSGESESKITQRSDEVYRHIVRPAAEACGYDVVRSYRLSTTERTIPKIIQHLSDDPIVVADLTGYDPNVLYELGYRWGLGKPVVQLIQEGQELPFDIFDIPTVYWNLDADGVGNHQAELVDKIREAEKEGCS